MTRPKTFFLLSVLISTLCLAGGFASAGQWLGVLVAILAGFGWLLAEKYPGSGADFICLFVSFGLAVTGVLSGCPAVLMIYVSGFSVAAWDLLRMGATPAGSTSGEQSRRYEDRHLISLALALGAGLLSASLGRFLHLDIPFVALLLLAGLAIYGLDRIWNTIKKRSVRIRR